MVLETFKLSFHSLPGVGDGISLSMSLLSGQGPVATRAPQGPQYTF